MTFHIFGNKSRSGEYAATDDESGKRLPDPEQWNYKKSVSESRIGFDAKEAEAGIKEHGFYPFRVELKTTVSGA